MRAILLLAAVGLTLSACTGTGPAPVAAPPPTTTAAVQPSLLGYADACKQAVRLGAEWMDLVSRAVDSVDLTDIPREEVEALINQLAVVTPLLPAEVQPEVTAMVNPLVQVRGVQLTGAAATVSFADGRDAMMRVVVLCGPYIPR